MPRCNRFGLQEPISGSSLLAGTKSLSTQKTGCRLILLIELPATAINDLRTRLAQPMSGSFALKTGWVRVDPRVFAHSFAPRVRSESAYAHQPGNLAPVTPLSQ